MEQAPSFLTARWYALVAAVYVTGLVWLGLALRHNVGFPLDDSWIHQEIARNLVEHHSWGFTPGVTSSGSSSTLWTLVLALDYLLVPHASPVWFPLVLNACLLTLSGILLWRMAALDRLPLIYGLALALLPAVTGNYVWLAFIGMEHVLFVVFSLTAILLWFRSSEEADGDGKGCVRASVSAGIVLGALGMTRPEGLALSVLLFALYKWCGRTVGDVARAAAAAVLFLVPSFLINLKTSGTLLPMTLRGRLFLFANTEHLHIGRSTVRELMLDSWAKVIQHNFFLTTHRWPLVFVLLACWGCVALLRRFPNRTSILVLWAGLHYASYCFTLPATGQGGRYQPFVLELFAPLMAVGAADLLALAARLISLSSRLLVFAQAAALVAVAAITLPTMPRWQRALGESIYNVDNCHVKMAEYMNAHLAPGTPVGVFDIGAIGYFSDIDLIDLGGLVDRNYLPYLFHGRVPEYLRERGADYIVLAHDGPMGYTDSTDGVTRLGDQLHFFHNPALRLEEIHTEAIDYATWYRSYLYTQHAYQYQTLYRIVWLDQQ
jgi:hypothetical protein